jgi:hypothetical protein
MSCGPLLTIIISIQSRLVFQHDNDPKHTRKIMQEWLASQSFQLIQWLAQSPEFELHWTFLGTSQTSLERIYDTFKRYPRIVGAVCSMYPNFSERDCMASYENMPWRIDIVLKSMGYWTNY